MSLRAAVRLLRLYYRSVALFRRAFANYYRAWWFPFFGAGRFVPRTAGVAVAMPRRYWTMLPTAARLVLMGASPRWDDERLHVTYQGLEFVAPPLSKMIGQSLREIFVEDVYRLKDTDLSGKVVLDIGAYIGDSSVAFARRGAIVHAFEPEARCQPLLLANIESNRFGDRIHAHAVGLSDKDEVIPPPPDQPDQRPLVLVDAQRYLRENNIPRVDILKLDCEGCEYELFRRGSFLLQLSPPQIIMEYHRGGENMVELLQDHGYTVEWPERVDPVGYLYAHRHAASTGR